MIKRGFKVYSLVYNLVIEKTLSAVALDATEISNNFRIFLQGIFFVRKIVYFQPTLF